MADAPNDPVRFDPRHAARHRGGMHSAGLAAVLIACSLVVVIVLYAVNRGDEPVVTTSAPTTTTGQSQKAPEPGPSSSEPKAKSEEKKSGQK